jgi:asparagine synthase (glutamine-hydrolysing)
MLLPSKKEERTLFGRLKRMTEISRHEGLNRFLAIIHKVRKNSPCLSKKQIGMPGLSLDFAKSSGNSLLEQVLQFDLKNYLVDNIHFKTDRASMRYGLEVRAPFMGEELLNFALALPPGEKFSFRKEKDLLKKAFAEALPKNILARPKMGFALPLARWMRGELGDLCLDILLSQESRERGIIDTIGVQETLKAHKEKRGDFSQELYTLLALELWFRNN